ncbi:MAG: amidohydrolase family protein [Deltaproteobacteria bacterium]|nr:amidohydrolase family protein [Deltaproteobacteria bacterium]
MRRALRRLTVLGIVLILGLGWLWIELSPPHLAVPPPSVSLPEVVIVNPGRDRRKVARLGVRAGRIAWLGEGGIGPRLDVEDPMNPFAPDTSRYAGAYVLPGLIDMHVHQPPDTPLGDVELAALLFLRHGVTAVRDTGSFDGAIFEERRRIAAGEIAGPRIFACGPILDGDPPFWSGSRVVRTAADGRRAVDELAAQHVSCIKVYDRVSPEALAGIREAAETHALPVIGHVPAAIPFSEARLADVQHLSGLVEPGEKLTEARIRGVVTASAALQIAHTPTLVFLDRVARLADYRNALAAPEAQLLPRYYREILWDPAHDPRLSDLGAADEETLQGTLRNAKRVVKQLADAGVEIHVGTDTMNPFVVPGASMHEEMWALVDAGLTPEQVWIAATRSAGRALGEQNLGIVRIGAPADLLIFREDPSVDLNHLQTLEAVVAGGRLYPREVLEEGVARWQRHFAGTVYDAVSTTLARWLVPPR